MDPEATTKLMLGFQSWNPGATITSITLGFLYKDSGANNKITARMASSPNLHVSARFT